MSEVWRSRAEGRAPGMLRRERESEREGERERERKH
jgi:hypothetical protein